MRILVTGSEGTLGVPLCGELRANGHSVYRVDLQHGVGEDYCRADVANYRQLAAAFHYFEPHAVYHLAAEFGRLNGEGWYEQLWKTNAIGTRNVLELCFKHEAQLVFASSSEVYGEIKRDPLMEEDTYVLPIEQPNEYALSKWVNEVQIRNFAKRRAMPKPIVCRFFNAYGPGEEYHDFRSVVALFCYRALNDTPFKVYEGYSRTFMYIDDFIPTLARVIDKGLPGRVYNIGGVDYRSVEELAEIVIEEAGASPSLVERVDQDEHNVRSKRPDCTLARRDLGHDPSVRLEDGVPATLRWMRSHYSL